MSENTSAALATCALVPAVFGALLPPLAQVRSAHPLDVNVSAGVELAALVSTGLVAAAAVVTRDRQVIAFGCGTALAFAVLYTHAREVWTE